MFTNIPERIAARMRWLKAFNAGELEVKPPPPGSIWPIHEDAARLIAIIAAGAPDGLCVEIGSGGGYSGLWLALAMRERLASGKCAPESCVLHTFELDEARAALSRETYAVAGIEDVISPNVGDAAKGLEAYEGIAFAFLDSNKKDYANYFDLLVQKLVTGGIIAADNAISHRNEMLDFLEKAAVDARVDAITIPLGQGVFVIRRCASK